jgi:hypothetical protein
MAIGPVGNAIFVNQMTANATAMQNAHNNRVEFQNMMAQVAANEKDKQVLEVRPTEENQEVDPDREHQKNESDQENARNKDKKDLQDKEEQNIDFSSYKLDIKV